MSGWLRLDATILSDPRVVQATMEHGPRAIAAYIFTLTTAKLANDGGKVELSAVVMARDCGLTLEEAKGAITTLVTVGLVSMTGLPDVFRVPNWEKYQPDPRNHAAREAAKVAHPGRAPGRPKSLGSNGGERGETVGNGIRDVDGTSTEKTSSAREPRRGGSQARRQAADAELRRIAAGEA